MALKSHSVFYYGHVVDDTNNLINFTDSPGGPVRTAELPVGSYTLTKYLQVVANALNAASAIDWNATVDRATRIVTLTSSSAADLLFGTGPNALNSPYALLGFTQTDKLNQTSFVGSFASGNIYQPQFPIQDYVPKQKNKKLVNSVVTKSATGDNLSVQNFGIERFIRGNIKFITNNPTSGKLRYNSSAVEEAEAFLDFIIEKHPIEFMADENQRDVYDRVYLESSNEDSNGTSHRLIEYVDRDLPEFFETGLLNFKVINRE